ncbi:hypothetical protein [Miniimonas sp. S16]|uniref:hypothetical protein n=1 Tax=Miniimonas sp. S16 TaxID=2171623 RepID=UPI000D5279A2|nr:hypothetical protein [Miniimonas sp. S16]
MTSSTSPLPARRRAALVLRLSAVLSVAALTAVVVPAASASSLDTPAASVSAEAAPVSAAAPVSGFTGVLAAGLGGSSSAALAPQAPSTGNPGVSTQSIFGDTARWACKRLGLFC